MTAKNLKADLVVLGGGGAGLAAALAAAENGCKCIYVLEKAGSATGSTGMAHDIFGAESPVQKRLGIEASRDELFKTAMEWAHWTNINPRIVRAFIDKSGETIGWLEQKGLSFEMIQYYPNQVPLVRHSVKGHGHALMKTLRDRYNTRGVALSGYGMEEDIKKSLDAGFTEHLTKPVDLPQLQECLARCSM